MGFEPRGEASRNAVTAEGLEWSLQPGKHPRPLTRNEVLALPPSPEACFPRKCLDHWQPSTVTGPRRGEGEESWTLAF